MIFLTTTAVEIDEELLNRCLVLTVDESREQTRRIHELQRKAATLEGILAARRKPKALKVHRNAQRLLRPLPVHNPYADRLTFLDEKTRARRDHVKYLKLIEAIALLHQHQRPVKCVQVDGEVVEYVEATLDDVALANRLASEVLGRSLDELPPQTRRLLEYLDEMVSTTCVKQGSAREDLRFSRRDVRRFTAWGDTQLRIHLDRLVSLEYLLVHRGGRGQSFVYELLYRGEGRDGRPFLLGLIDSATLGSPDLGRTDLPPARGTTETSRGEAGHLAGGSRPQRGAFAGRSRGEGNELRPALVAGLDGLPDEEPAEALPGTEPGIPSYPPPAPRLLLRRASGGL